MNKKLSNCLLLPLLGAALISGCAVVDHVKADMATLKAEEAYSERKFEDAAKSYQQADAAGGGYAQMMLGRMHLQGVGVRKDVTEGRRLITKAADGGYPPAHNMLGLWHWQGGNGLRADRAKAVEHFRKSADLKDEFGAFMMGVAHARGQGVRANANEALRWFQEAKKRGFAVDQRLLTEDGLASYMRRSSVAVARDDDQRMLMRQIQEALLKRGYDPGPVDGIYGAKTRKAIEDFQKAAGMVVDGKASRIVLDTLKAAQ
jgi:TPR repeat protein